MTIDYVGDLLPDSFTLEHIAYAFITAMGDEALKDFNGGLSHYIFVDYERPDNPVRLVINPAPGANPIRLVRKNLLWCLRELPIEMFDGPSIWGSNFVAKFMGQNLYFGKLDNRHRPLVPLLASSSDSLNRSDSPTQTNISPLEDRTNKTSLSLPPSSLTDPQIDIIFNDDHPGDPLPSKAIFSTLLHFIYRLAPEDGGVRISHRYLADQFPVWIFIIHTPGHGITQKLENRHVIRLLKLVGQRYIFRHVYEEVAFRLVAAGGRAFALGCVTKREEGRRWCSGLTRGMGLTAVE